VFHHQFHNLLHLALAWLLVPLLLEEVPDHFWQSESKTTSLWLCDYRYCLKVLSKGKTTDPFNLHRGFVIFDKKYERTFWGGLTMVNKNDLKKGLKKERPE
jgi:hypothetical protein